MTTSSVGIAVRIQRDAPCKSLAQGKLSMFILPPLLFRAARVHLLAWFCLFEALRAGISEHPLTLPFLM